MKYIFIILFLIMGILIWLVIKSDQQWMNWANEHHCIDIGHIEGSVGVANGININTGQLITGTVYIPGKTTYKCDDGKFYTR